MVEAPSTGQGLDRLGDGCIVAAAGALESPAGVPVLPPGRGVGPGIAAVGLASTRVWSFRGFFCRPQPAAQERALATGGEEHR